MRKRQAIIISILVFLALVVSIYQYLGVWRAEIVSAVQTIPSPGHAWSEMESGPASIQVSGRTITNLATPVNSTDAVNKAYVDSLVSLPSGVILIWSGSIASIPSGWALCNGSNGTPDLRDRFVVGAGSGYSVAAIGGEATHTLTISEMPSHYHSQTAHTHSFSGSGSIPYCGSNCSGSGGFSPSWGYTGPYPISISGTIGLGGGGSTGSEGGGAAHNNLPPYYSLAYIMKL